MTVVTLIDPVGQNSYEKTEQIRTEARWTYPNTVSRTRERAQSSHSVGDVGQAVYETSFIQLVHPGGKVWDSLFVPLSRDGTIGLSISRWGKDHWVKGQSQVKISNEREWSNVVRTKMTAGGYEADGFIGRTTPLDMKFNIMSDLHDKAAISTLPQLALGRGHAEKISLGKTESEIGRLLGRACSNIFPIAKFFEHANWQGHDLPAQMVGQLNSYGGTGAKDIGLMFARYINEGVTDVFEEATEVIVEPAIDREAAYAGTWGGFA